MNDFYANSKKENFVAGIFGAFLFSLAGAACWFLLDLVGIVASLSGFIGVICAIYGYKLFAKKESVRGIIISAVIAFIVLIFAWFFSFALDVYRVHIELYNAGEIGFKLTYAEAVDATLNVYIREFSVSKTYFLNLALGLVFALAGSFSVIAGSVKKLKSDAAPEGDDAAPKNVESAKITSDDDKISNKWND